MHHLFVDVSQEIAINQKPIKLIDLFVERLVGFESDSQHQQSAPKEQSQEEEIEEIADTKHTFNFNTKPLISQTFLFKDASISFNTEVQSTLRLPIVYIFALPEDFNYNAFLTSALAGHLEEISDIRVLIEPNRKKMSIIIYFKDKQAAESFVQQYNCSSINENKEEFMLIISLATITFIKNIGCLGLAMEEQQKVNLTELPSCPICIEKLETAISGFQLNSMMSLAIYENPDRWKAVKEACSTCSVSFATSHCILCGEEEGLWACLVCGNIGCGRYKKGHAKEHWYSSGHCLSMEAESERIWDYSNDTFVHRIMKGDNGKTFIVNSGCSISFSNPTNSDVLGNSHMQIWNSTDEKGEELNTTRVDNAIWEYCYVISHQMEEQRIYFEKRIEEVQKEQMVAQKDGQDQHEELHKVLKEVQINRERVRRERETCHKKQKTINEKNEEMKKEINQLELFQAALTNNIQELQLSSNQKDNNTVNSNKNLDTNQILLKEIDQSQAQLEQLTQQLDALYLQLAN